MEIFRGHGIAILRKKMGSQERKRGVAYDDLIVNRWENELWCEMNMDNGFWVS